MTEGTRPAVLVTFWQRVFGISVKILMFLFSVKENGFVFAFDICLQIFTIRIFAKVNGYPVFGTAQPTEEGFRF